MNIQMKATEQYFPVVLFVLKYFTKCRSLGYFIFAALESEKAKLK